MLIIVPAMKQPPDCGIGGPEPPLPEVVLPVASPNPDAVVMKFSPELNIAFQVPLTLTYPAVICFHAPDTLVNIEFNAFQSPSTL